MTLPLPLVIFANAGVGKSWAGAAAEVLSGLVGGLFALLGALDLLGVPVLSNVIAGAPTGDWRYAMDVTIVAVGFLGAAIAADPVRRRLARISTIEPDNPVHALGLTLAVILFGSNLALVAFTDVFTAELSQPPLNAGDVIFSEAPLLIMGLAGVGLFLRRDIAATAQRLGLVRPAWWHPVLALAAAGLFIVVTQLMVALSYQITPQLTQHVDVASRHLFGDLSSGLAGVVLLAVVPGLCEDILFRGALQPRLGLLATALLFASTHTEYGLSVVILAVLVLAIGLGLIRKYTNTTTSMTCHIAYNLLVGFGIAGAVVYAAVAAEVILIAVSAYAIWNQRRAATAPINP